MKRFLAIVGLILLCLFVVGLATYRHFVEPRHNGKSLSEWCGILAPSPAAPHKGADLVAASQAIRDIGGRARYWMLVWAEPGGDPFREFRHLWNKFAPALVKWHPPKDPRSMAAILATVAPDEMRLALPELVRRARNADWNAVVLIMILAQEDESVWIEILKSPDDQASAWALEHFRNLPSRSEAFGKGLTEAYRTNREPILGSEMLLWRVNRGASGPEILREIRRHLSGDPFREQAFCAASAAVTLESQGRPILIDGMFSNVRTTRDACTAAFRLKEIVEHDTPVSLPFRDTLIRFAKGLDVELSRQDAAVVLLADKEPAIRIQGLKLLESSVSARLKAGFKPAIGSRRVALKIEALTQANDAALAKPLAELLRHVSLADAQANTVSEEISANGK